MWFSQEKQEVHQSNDRKEMKKLISIFFSEIFQLWFPCSRFCVAVISRGRGCGRSWWPLIGIRPPLSPNIYSATKTFNFYRFYFFPRWYAQRLPISFLFVSNFVLVLLNKTLYKNITKKFYSIPYTWHKILD